MERKRLCPCIAWAWLQFPWGSLCDMAWAQTLTLGMLPPTGAVFHGRQRRKGNADAACVTLLPPVHHQGVWQLHTGVVGRVQKIQ